MAYEIIYKRRYATNFVNILSYLEKEWGKKTADEFVRKLDEILNLLKYHPHMGAPSKAVQDARCLFVTKHNRLFYRIEGNSIIILFLADSRRKNYEV